VGILSTELKNQPLYTFLILDGSSLVTKNKAHSEKQDNLPKNSCYSQCLVSVSIFCSRAFKTILLWGLYQRKPNKFCFQHRNQGGASCPSSLICCGRVGQEVSRTQVHLQITRWYHTS